MANYRAERNINRVYPETQRMANMLSSYTKGRKYRYSEYQQIFNTFSLQLNQLSEAIDRHGDNKVPQSYRLDGIDVVYVTDKPQSFIGNETFKSGTTDIISSPYNTYEEWWYDTVPYSLSRTNDTYTPMVLCDDIPPCPVIPINTLIEESIPLYVNLFSEEGSFIKNIYGEYQTPSFISIFGTDVYGKNVKEVFSFSYSTYSRSNIEWKYIERIECDMQDKEELFALNIGTHICKNLTYIEDKNLSYVDNNKISKPLFWSWDNENKVLLHSEFNAESISDVYAGIKGISPVKQYKLQFYNGTTIVDLDSIESYYPSETNNELYVISNNNFIIYNKLIEYPSVVKKASQMTTPDASVKINAHRTTNGINLSTTVERESLGKIVSSYRFSIESGSTYKQAINVKGIGSEETKWIDFDDTYETYEDKIKFGKRTINLFYEHRDVLRDDVIVKLELILSDGRKEVDTVVLEKEIKTPIFQQKINVGTALLDNISYNPKTVPRGGGITLSHPNRANTYKYDNPTYITTDKYIVFSSDYKDLKLNGNKIELKPHNVHNELDGWGTVVGLSRKTGEHNSSFLKRLKYSYNNRLDSTKRGLTAAVATELQLTPKIIAMYEIESPIIISIINSKYYFGTEANFKYNTLFSAENIFELLDAMKTVGVKITDIDSSLHGLESRFVQDLDNRIEYNNITAKDQNRIPLYKKANEYIMPSTIKIDGFSCIENNEEFKDKTYKIIDVDGSITLKTSQLLSPLDAISYTAVSNRGYISASLVSTTSMANIEDYSFKYDSISKIANLLIQDAETYHPSKWSF